MNETVRRMFPVLLSLCARDAALRAGIVMGAVSAVMRAWYAGDGKGDLRAMGVAALDLVERGLGARS